VGRWDGSEASGLGLIQLGCLSEIACKEENFDNIQQAGDQLEI
jgi:hypothetical protein